MKLILDLCGGTGSWSLPYAVAEGYSVIIVDPKGNGRHSLVVEKTVEDFFEELTRLPELPIVHGILAAPPCTDFSTAGRAWFNTKDNEGQTLVSLITVVACLNIIDYLQPVWWALENPVGRLRSLMSQRLGEPRLSFQPSDYGDPYTKRTLIWGNFTIPVKSPVEAWMGSVMQHLPENKYRAEVRSITPPGFAKAFFEANP